MWVNKKASFKSIFKWCLFLIDYRTMIRMNSVLFLVFILFFSNYSNQKKIYKYVLKVIQNLNSSVLKIVQNFNLIVLNVKKLILQVWCFSVFDETEHQKRIHTDFLKNGLWYFKSTCWVDAKNQLCKQCYSWTLF